MLIYLIRHLPTEYTRRGLYMGRSYDLPILQDTAESFIEHTARLLPESGVNPSVIYSSPAQRCLQTAALLQDCLGHITRPHVLVELHETNYGAFEGKSAQEIKSAYPETFHYWMEQPGCVRFPDGETLEEVQERATTCLQHLITQLCSSVGALYLVTHVDVIKMLLCWLLGTSINDKRLFHVDPGSFTCLATTENIYNKKRLALRYLNLTP